MAITAANYIGNLWQRQQSLSPCILVTAAALPFLNDLSPPIICLLFFTFAFFFAFFLFAYLFSSLLLFLSSFPSLLLPRLTNLLANRASASPRMSKQSAVPAKRDDAPRTRIAERPEREQPHKKISFTTLEQDHRPASSSSAELSETQEYEIRMGKIRSYLDEHRELSPRRRPTYCEVAALFVLPLDVLLAAEPLDLYVVCVYMPRMVKHCTFLSIFLFFFLFFFSCLFRVSVAVFFFLFFFADGVSKRVEQI